MSSEERGNVISLITAFLVTVPYLFYVSAQHYNVEPNAVAEVIFWANAFLLMIPIRIIGEIVMRIIGEIVNAIVTGKEQKIVADERDKLIELKGTRNSSFLFIVGFMISMIVVSTTGSITNMFIVMIISGFISEILGTLSQLYYYRKGI